MNDRGKDAPANVNPLSRWTTDAVTDRMEKHVKKALQKGGRTGAENYVVRSVGEPTCTKIR